VREKTKVRAQHKWRGILSQLGLTPKELSGKHTTCPNCGGTDRFRFTDYKGGGEYFCSGCGAGGGLDLLMKKFGWSFRDAVLEVDRILGTGVEETFQPKIDIEKRRKDLNSVWGTADKPLLVAQYLATERGIRTHLEDDSRFRGLTDVRGTDCLYDSDTGQRGEGIVSLIRNKMGHPISIHRIYLDSRSKKIMPPLEKITGAGIRLGWHKEDDTLIIGEGLETTVAGMADFRHPGLATISAHGMEEVDIPQEFTKFIILADNDRSFTGQKAAFTLGRRIDQKNRQCRIMMPEEAGQDFLDCSVSRVFDNDK